MNLYLESGVPINGHRETLSVSTAGIGVVLAFEGMETAIEFSVPLFGSEQYIPLRASFDQGLGLFDIAKFVCLLFQIGD